MKLQRAEKMAKPTLTSYMRDNIADISGKNEPGPFVTISRQYGCDGYELGELLVKTLNERTDKADWQLLTKELLGQLAEDTGMDKELIEKQRLSKPSLFKDLMTGMRRGSIPDGYEVRGKITIMVRTAAFNGHTVIIGQGGTAATADLDNGLSVRIEAPKEWRIVRVSRREKLSRLAAIARIGQVEKKRKHLRKVYEKKNPRQPAFNLTIDNSAFNITQAIDQIVFAMEQKELIPKPK